MCGGLPRTPSGCAYVRLMLAACALPSGSRGAGVCVFTNCAPILAHRARGRVTEWFKVPVLKTGRGATLSWVRIPPRPPHERPPSSAPVCRRAITPCKNRGLFPRALSSSAALRHNRRAEHGQQHGQGVRRENHGQDDGTALGARDRRPPPAGVPRRRRQSLLSRRAERRTRRAGRATSIIRCRRAASCGASSIMRRCPTPRSPRSWRRRGNAAPPPWRCSSSS